jgi:hypothetical protein
MRTKTVIATVALLTVLGATGYFLVGRRGCPRTAMPQAGMSRQEEQEAAARQEFAFVSLAERIPKGRRISPHRPLDGEAKKRWDNLDANLATYQNRRAELLKALHERSRKFFVESPGNGSGRFMIPDERILVDGWPFTSTEASAQPGEPAMFPVSPGEPLTRLSPTSDFYFYHDGAMFDFLDPTRFGYVKNRDHVAGFRSHGFRHLGVPVYKPWRVQTIQLIGILLHDEPVVYLTDKLPRMEQVHQGTSRPLDFFEDAALPALLEGEDLYIVQKDETIRMLGALRATKTCQQCHDAEVADLLGAFSYTLRPATKDELPKE